MKTFLIDADKCIDCRNCQIACKDEHCDNDWSPISAPQGPGQFWIRIITKEAGSGARIKMHRLPLLCQHCARPSCKDACSHDAIYQRADGIVIIDPTKCTGCGDCAEACPYGVIYRNEQEGRYQKCTFCAHLLDAGSLPRCLTACPSDALRFIDTDGLIPDRHYASLEKLHAEYGTEPQVLYMNLPRPFIAGEVCSPDLESSIPNVRVVAKHQITGESFCDVTDAFGEFSLQGLTPGYYTVSFEKDGYAYKSLSNILADESVNVEEVKLYALG